MIVLIGRALLVTLTLTIVGPLAALLLGLRLPEPVPGSSAITLARCSITWATVKIISPWGVVVSMFS